MEDGVNIAALAAFFDGEEEEEEEVLRALSIVAVLEIMALEEDEFLGDENSWVAITVDVDEYHRMGDPSFKLHFRMSRTVFESVTLTIHEHLRSKGRLRRERTPFSNVMLMVLWIIATPDSFRSVALRFGVRPGTLHYFYTYIIEALRELAATFISWPTPDERRVVKAAFERATGFPGVIGCIDCTHVSITAPLEDAQQYINRHHSFSMNVQAVVDSNLIVRHLHVGEVGSMNDARVFRKSPLHQHLLHSEPGDFVDIDEHLVGDGAYTVTNFMMRPFENNGHLSARQLNYNRRLSQSRVRVENAFALGKGKWRRLKFLHARNPLNVVDHITASFVLHNMVILHGQPLIDEEELARPLNNAQVLGNERFDLDNLDDLEHEDVGLMEAAEAMGEEKRLMIVDNLFALVDE